jgi:hypothetical protein
MIREDRHHRMTHHAMGVSMPRDNQRPNRTACNLASQVVRVRETEDRRTFRLLYDSRIQTAVRTIISLSSRSLFKTVFRGLSYPDGRVSYYDLVTKLINSQKFGRGGPLALINSMLEAGRIERLPGGYYRAKSSRRA